MTFLFRLHLLTYLVSLWAFLTLVFTGQIHVAAILLFLLFWGLAVLRDQELWRNQSGTFWAGMHKLVSVQIPRWIWTLISLSAFGAAMYGWFVLEERMYAVTYFFFYLELNKLLTARGNRDVLQIYALTFFHMLAASVSTYSFVFAPMLLGYLFLILQALSTFTIKRDVEGVLADKAKTDALSLQNFSTLEPYRLKDSDARALSNVAYDRLDFRLVGMLVQRNFALLSLAVALLGMCVFWIVPRTAKQNFFNPGLRSGALTTRISGYADEVSFGGMGNIQNDPTIIMRAQPLKGYVTSRPTFLRIRGTALDRFTGRVWSKSNTLIANTQSLGRVQDINFLEESLDPAFERIFKAKLTLEPTKTNYFFTVDQPISVHTQAPVSFFKDPDALSLKLEADRYETVSYEANALLRDRESYLDGLQQGKIAKAPEFEDLYQDPNFRRLVKQVTNQIIRLQIYDNLSYEEAEAQAREMISKRPEFGLGKKTSKEYLQLPVAIPSDQLKAIATEWTKDLTTPAEKALAIERRLKMTFNYSLDINFSNREDHVMYFLTESRTGHCEYFATGMVLLLRSIDIPARIVNGYLSDEWSESQESFIVRQENAHSWVEAQIGPDRRWITFDPTPEDGIGSNRIAISWYHRFSAAFHGFRMWWYNNIVDYSVEDQRDSVNFLVRMLFSLSRNSQQSLNSFQGLFEKGSSGAASTGKQLLIVVLIAAVLVSILVALLYFAQGRSQKLKKKRELIDRGLREDLLPFREFLNLLQEHFPRLPGQPPLEYIQELSAKLPEELQGIIPLTERYYEARFGELTLSPQEHQEINHLKREIRQFVSR